MKCAAWWHDGRASGQCGRDATVEINGEHFVLNMRRADDAVWPREKRGTRELEIVTSEPHSLPRKQLNTARN